MLLITNFIYAKLAHRHRYTAKKLPQLIIGFSVVTISCIRLGITYLTNPGVTFFLTVWNLVIYVLTGYAFWGITAIILNVRESLREIDTKMALAQKLLLKQVYQHRCKLNCKKELSKANRSFRATLKV